ncbi:MAG TPA: serine/threonine-protein kinase [Labilithrix sp.]|nr:serine/threonine-protein kinase [Labilithrix sp.]
MIASLPPAGVASARTIGGHRLVAGLGKGGMARVYLAIAQKQGGFTKLLVLKVLRAELDSEGDFLTMFMQEARLAARLNHPNVVQTYEVGEDANRHYIAMEYLEGQALSSVLSRIGRDAFPLDVHLRILCDALEGLHYAHELADYDGTPLKIVHRDISPQNVFVTYTGQAKILDFGIAKVSGSTHTATGVLKGKAAYMAPEQATGKPDRRSDIFAVGVMLWEAIAKQRFVQRHEEDVIILTRRISGKERLIRDVVPDAPPELAEICDKAMAGEPDQRFATAAEMRDAIEAHLRKSDPVDARRVAATLEPTFAEERTRIRRLVDEQVKRADDTGPMIDLHRQGSVMTPPGVQASFDVPVDFAATKVSAPRRFPVSLVLVLGAVVLVAGGVLAMRRGREPQAGAASPAASSTPSAPPALVAAASASAEPTAAEKITVAIRTTPPDATLVVDGQTVRNPFAVEVVKDGSRHTVQASARGHASETTSVAYDGPHELVLTLKPATAAAPPRPASSADVDLASLKSKRPKRTVDDKDPYQ